MEDENEADAQLEAPQNPPRAEEAKAPHEHEVTSKDLDADGDLSQMEEGAELESEVVPPPPPLDPASMSLSLIASTPSPLVRNLSSSNS